MAPPPQEATAALAAGGAGARALEEARLRRRSASTTTSRTPSTNTCSDRRWPTPARCSHRPTTRWSRRRTPSTRWSSTSSACSPGQRLLDVGCGWGSMVRHAARRGVQALGVTLSRQQAEWGQKAIVDEGLQHLAEVRLPGLPRRRRDRLRRDLLDRADRAHRGAELPGVLPLAAATSCGPGGRLLNHCITRPTNNIAGQARGVHRPIRVPGRRAHRIRPDHHRHAGRRVRRAAFREPARALRSHAAGLVREPGTNWDACVAEVGEGTARVWGLYMAASRLELRAQRDPAAPGAGREARARRATPRFRCGPGGPADRPQRVTANPVAPPPAMAMTPDNARTGTGVQLSAVPPLPS